jgi:hypothetical protein
LFLTTQNIFPDVLFAQLTVEDTHYFLTLDYQWEAEEEILEPIESGLKSEMTFIIQLCQKREGILSFLGDIVILEKIIHSTGYKDFFENVYVIEDESGDKMYFQAKADFIKAFQSLSRYPIDDFLWENKSILSFLRVKGRVYQVKLIVPLTLIYFFSSKGIIESDWKIIHIQ